MDQLIGFVHAMWRKVQENDTSGLAAELSYRLFVASVPVVAFVASVGAIVANLVGGDNPAETIVGSFGEALPSDVANTLETELEGLIETSGFLAVAGTLAGSLWTGSLAMGSVVKALDRIHGYTERRSRFQRAFLAVGLSTSTGLLLATALVGLLVSQLYQDDLAEWVGLGDPSTAVVTFGAWLIAFLLVVAAAAMIYRLVPPGEPEGRWVSLGALAFGSIWLIGSAVFILYISNFDAFPGGYGLIGLVLLALAWLYFSSTAFLIGAQLDLTMQEQIGKGDEERSKPDTRRREAEEPRQRR